MLPPTQHGQAAHLLRVVLQLTSSSRRGYADVAALHCCRDAVAGGARRKTQQQQQQQEQQCSACCRHASFWAPSHDDAMWPSLPIEIYLRTRIWGPIRPWAQKASTTASAVVARRRHGSPLVAAVSSLGHRLLLHHLLELLTLRLLHADLLGRLLRHLLLCVVIPAKEERIVTVEILLPLGADTGVHRTARTVRHCLRGTGRRIQSRG